jgi:suppressor of fused
MSAPDDISTPGWDAIDRALAPLYRDVTPRHFGTLIRHRLGGPDPLDGISAYPRDTPFLHWHFVTYGFTELYGLEEDSGGNGFGFELTFRLARQGNEAEPPMWALSFLQNLARYVFESGNRFKAGDHLNCNSPLSLDQPTDLRAVLFAKDTELGPIEAEHGSAEFLQVVGITLDELTAVQAWNGARFTELMRMRIPLLGTDLARRSILSNAAVAETVRNEIEREGSSTGLLFVSTLHWRRRRSIFRADQVQLTIGAGQAEVIAAVLRGRLPHGRELQLSGQDRSVRFVPATTCDVESSKQQLELHLTRDAAMELSAKLLPRSVRFALDHFPALRVIIEPTRVTDANGRVVETIG